MQKKQLRTQLQQQRQALTLQQQIDASQRICQHITQLDAFKCAQHIAFYTPVNGEANPLFLQQNTDKFYYLPVLSTRKRHHLLFVKIDDTTRYKNNKYAIPEPIYTANDIRPAEALDWVIMPLVAVDQRGNRLGMGGGYYDRCFAFKQQKNVTTPKLLGFAYHFQRVAQLTAEPWDVPLDFIATEKELVML